MLVSMVAVKSIVNIGSNREMKVKRREGYAVSVKLVAPISRRGENRPLRVAIHPQKYATSYPKKLSERKEAGVREIKRGLAARLGVVTWTAKYAVGGSELCEDNESCIAMGLHGPPYEFLD